MAHYESSKMLMFFGPDGSGKTALAEGLARNLDNRGLKTKLSWMRGTHTLASILARFLSRFKSFRGDLNPYYSIDIPIGMRRLWQWIEFVSAIPVIAMRYTVPMKMGKWVVAERGVPDFIAWVRTTTDDKDYLKRPEARFLLIMSSKAHMKVFVTASLEELLKRRPESDSGFVKRQLAAYDEIATLLCARRIDTTDKTVEDSLRELIDPLGNFPSIDVRWT